MLSGNPSDPFFWSLGLVLEPLNISMFYPPIFGPNNAEGPGLCFDRVFCGIWNSYVPYKTAELPLKNGLSQHIQTRATRVVQRISRVRATNPWNVGLLKTSVSRIMGISTGPVPPPMPRKTCRKIAGLVKAALKGIHVGFHNPLIKPFLEEWPLGGWAALDSHAN